MPKLSIIVPVYNEEPQLTEFIARLLSAPCPIEREWIFIDDSSSDHSLEILKRYSDRVRVLEQRSNGGKGAACLRGLKEATGDIVMIQDADLEYDMADVPALLQPILEDRADVVYGSRFTNRSAKTLPLQYFANMVLTFVSNLFSGSRLTDVATCYKVFRADLLLAMNARSMRFGFDFELTAYVAKTKARVIELPISYTARTKNQGKKITWKDGIAALFHLFRFNFFVTAKRAFTNLPERY